MGWQISLVSNGLRIGRWTPVTQASGTTLDLVQPFSNGLQVSKKVWGTTLAKVRGPGLQSHLWCSGPTWPQADMGGLDWTDGLWSLYQSYSSNPWWSVAAPVTMDLQTELKIQAVPNFLCPLMTKVMGEQAPAGAWIILVLLSLPFTPLWESSHSCTVSFSPRLKAIYMWTFKTKFKS